MPRSLRIMLLAAAISAVAACGDSSEVERCADRGVEYFKEIGAYPTLATPPNAGRKAEDVALERCRRNPTAF